MPRATLTVLPLVWLPPILRRHADAAFADIFAMPAAATLLML